jgi:hypothetical protein
VTLVAAWARAFALTLAVELVVATPLLAPSGASVARRSSTVALAQLASHPVLWLVLPELGLTGVGLLAVGETWAVAVEVGVYLLVFPSIGATRALAASALANGASVAVGLILRTWGGFV